MEVTDRYKICQEARWPGSMCSYAAGNENRPPRSCWPRQICRWCGLILLCSRWNTIDYVQKQVWTLHAALEAAFSCPFSCALCSVCVPVARILRLLAVEFATLHLNICKCTEYFLVFYTVNYSCTNQLIPCVDSYSPAWQTNVTSVY